MLFQRSPNLQILLNPHMPPMVSRNSWNLLTLPLRKKHIPRQDQGPWGPGGFSNQHTNEHKQREARYGSEEWKKRRSEQNKEVKKSEKNRREMEKVGAWKDWGSQKAGDMKKAGKWAESGSEESREQ